MARIAKFRVKYKDGGYDCYNLTDTNFGHKLQYAIKLDKFTGKQWLEAHDSVIKCLSREERQNVTSKNLKEVVLQWLCTPRKARASVKMTGIKISTLEPRSETSIQKVTEAYLSDFCKPEINSRIAIEKAKRQCRIVLKFLSYYKITYYSQLTREIAASYPKWCGKCSAYTANQEIRRLENIIKYGIKYCGWPERYLLEGIRVKPTPENTKSLTNTLSQ